MEPLIETLKTEWATYGIPDIFTVATAIIVAVFGYRNWQRTGLAVWVIFYGWTMAVFLSSDTLDLYEGMNSVFVCTYGLGGFFVMGYFIYENLKG